jgi:hypothetical protein
LPEYAEEEEDWPEVGEEYRKLAHTLRVTGSPEKKIRHNDIKSASDNARFNGMSSPRTLESFHWKLSNEVNDSDGISKSFTGRRKAEKSAIFTRSSGR